MKELGSKGFSRLYWDKNYSDPEEMDNIGNANLHVRYIQSLFHLEYLEINSIIDLGFGLGYLFNEAIKAFNPYRAYGIEPSTHAYQLAKKVITKPEETTKFKIENIDLLTWAKKVKESDKAFDLGICTSVFQYLSDEELEVIVPAIAKNVRFLYFSVPTNIEFKRQKLEYDFFDEFAIHRKKSFYLKLLRPHFTFISSRLLESKYFYDEDNTEFRELLFRF